MLFTFVILFLTLGCDLAYGQEQKENEEVTVTLDFTGLNYGLKGNDPIKPPILNKGVIVQNVNFFFIWSYLCKLKVYKIILLG